MSVRALKAQKSSATQPQLFQFIDMEALIPKSHILRQLNEAIDFSCVYDWVAPLYTERSGRPAADPERIVRLILLSYLFNHSERGLYEILPMHAGYLWFCGLDFESIQHPDPSRPSLPDRTTLVKTRKLWRQHGIFEKLMVHVINQCIAAGLVKPDVHVGVDGTQVRANASIHSLKEMTCTPVESIEDYLARIAQQDGQAEPSSSPHDTDDDPPSSPGSADKASRKKQGLQEEATHENFHGKTFSNATHRSKTDPDARLYKKAKGQEAHLRYLIHNVTDVTSGVILSTQASIASGVAERETSMQQLAAIRFCHPTIRVCTLSADKAYGTPDYLNALFEQGMIPLVSLRNLTLEDVPTWKRQTRNPKLQRKRLAKVKAVQVKNKARLIQLSSKYRHLQKLRTRCEHIFAESKCDHGLDRARSRGLDCMQEQALLTAMVQNLKRLCRFRFKKKPTQTGILACQNPTRRTIGTKVSMFFSSLLSLIASLHLQVRRFS
ncbi:IS5 family transposase [Numidum massiliense]|uniref:IS5 family transposase n=1 Tax=Numidum massiliense TaxID=1522315 RepID=UPI0006D541AD|nr:IS5 family transposase [Numidum massiliense]